ncbi:MAG: RdgB/HAM1 family non-canonical purine NTP pyrophosphatase [Sphaerochaetaceae bacterium]|nr:RdgB/HAM1 family non-canonical purine NTP pyrophosphatase [Sphaerochaetaceae bacterium]
MELLFASQNEHKRIEMASLLLPHSITLPSEIGIEFSYEEIADSFVGNALGKAEHLYNLTHKPSFADDSGLIVDALQGAPGIYSARYGSDLFDHELSAAEKNLFLLRNLEHIPPEQRTARFVCAIALIFTPYQRYIIQEAVEGFIAQHPSGEGGFGYDPIFLVGTGTKAMAQFTDSEKNNISHRALAAQKIASILQDIEQKEIVYVC